MSITVQTLTLKTLIDETRVLVVKSFSNLGKNQQSFTCKIKVKIYLAEKY